MTKKGPEELFARRAHANQSQVERLLDFLGDIPSSSEPLAERPRLRSKAIVDSARRKSAAVAGTLALPPGPLGWATILPEMYQVWKIQRQMVADLAACHGKSKLLSREQMLYCLFSHTSATAFRGLVVRTGERYLLRRAPLAALYAIANKIMLRIAQRSTARLVARMIPLGGAAAIGLYVYRETGKVGKTAVALYRADILIEGELEVEGAEILEQTTPGTPRKRAAKSTAKTSSAKTPAAKTSSRKKAAKKAAAKRS